MIRTLFSAADWRHILLRGWRFDLLIMALSLLTGFVVWCTHGQTFTLDELREIWLLNQGRCPPDVAALLVMMLLNITTALYLWLFCRVALSVGLGKVSVLLLFLLFNFNPEYNGVRFDVTVVQWVLLLWVLSMWLFLHYYQHHFYRAFLLWAACLICAALLEPGVWLWIIGFPLCFLLWPGSGRFWRRTWERIQFLSVFYVLCALLIVAVPLFRAEVSVAFSVMAERLKQALSAMSVFISTERGFDLAGYDAALIAWVLVLINAAKNAGVVIIGVVLVAVIKRPSAVLPGQVWLFFVFGFVYATLIAALSLLYLGHLQSDLWYVPVTMLMLWMSAAAVFYLYQRWRTQRMPVQNRLVLFWLMIAYAIASVIEFGPSSDYLRDGGVWAYEHRQGAVFSNSYQALFFAGERPLAEDNDRYWPQLDARALPAGFDERSLLLYAIGRHHRVPDVLRDFEQRAVFRNRRGDRLFVLALPGS